LRTSIVVLGTLLVSSQLSSASDSAREHLGVGLKLYQVERYSEAMDQFRLALEKDPGLSEARYYLAISAFTERRYAEARQQFERLREAGYQKGWVTYYFGRLDLVTGRLDRAIRNFESLKRPEPLSDELYYLGSAFVKKNEPARAIVVLQQQTHFNPRDFRAHNLLARAYMKTGRRQEAEKEFETSEELHEYYLQGKQELTACRNQLAAGLTEQAWSQCGSALRTDDIDKLVSVGTLFGEFRHYGYAAQAFKKALSLDSESPEINYNLGFTYFQLKHYPEAHQLLETALHLRPDFFEALAVEGTTLHQLHQDSAAAQVLHRAHTLRPNDQAVSSLLAQIDRGSRQ
jgi:tetratricopeptide (TPR) repeat protein